MNGILVVDKPSGISSFGVVRQVKSWLRTKKVGHTGTLDPFASGVLPLAINEGTKTVPFLTDQLKEYEAVLKLGVETDTYDRTGRITAARDLGRFRMDEETIKGVLRGFMGRIEQVPPMFSAVKHRGRRLYKLARRGIIVKRQPRVVEIMDIGVTHICLPLVSFKVACSKGTYIRTLAHDIGRELKCGAHLYQLQRTRSGPFILEEAIPFRDLKSLVERGMIEARIIPLSQVLGGLPELCVAGELQQKIQRGGQILVRDIRESSLPRIDKEVPVRVISSDGDLIAIARAEMGYGGPVEKEAVAFRLLRVFH
ncbi:MAG: tRNA pseudouridine(55) synthase TruB [Syntrophobacterales bacterium]|nr:MAG: tRNA pseudouridine(55) synthase TruB [Syntrophobacterales bacterium]